MTATSAQTTSATKQVAYILPRAVTMAINVLTMPAIVRAALTVRRYAMTAAPALPILAIRLKDASITQRTAMTKIPARRTHATARAIASIN